MNEKIAISIFENQPNPLLLVETKWSNCDQIIFDYIKSLNCQKEKPFCNHCLDCQKITKKKYFDLTYINGFNETINKEDVTTVLNSFTYSALEQVGNKFLVIYGIENCSKVILNSLLKAIENPLKNCFFIFVTRNIHAVLPTIKSRCIWYSLVGDLTQTQKILEANQIPQMDFKNLCNLYFSASEMIENFKNNKYQKHIEMIKLILDSLKNFSEHKKVLNEFKKLDFNEINIILNFLAVDQNQKIKSEINYLIDALKFKVNKTLIFAVLIKALLL